MNSHAQYPKNLILNRGRLTLAITAARADHSHFLEWMHTHTISECTIRIHSITTIEEQNETWLIWHIHATHHENTQNFQLWAKYIAPIAMSYPYAGNQEAVTSTRIDIIKKEGLLQQTCHCINLPTGYVLSVQDIPLIFIPNQYGHRLFAFDNPTL